MSIKIPIKELSIQNKETIKKLLVIEPKLTFAEIRNKTKKPWLVSTKEPIVFYNIDDQFVYLPYIFGTILLKKNINASRLFPESKFDFTGKLRPDQMIVSEEAMTHLKSSQPCTILQLYPGFGKTILASYLSSQLNGLVLVVYTLTTLENQWHNTFSNHTNAKVWINNSKKRNIYNDDVNVILSMDTRIKNLAPEILDKVKCLIIDEAHLFCTQKRVMPLLSTSPSHIIACSATLDKRVDGLESMIYALCGKNIVTREINKPVDVYKIDTGISIELPLNARGETNWSQLIKDYSVLSERNEIILQEVVKYKDDNKIIMLTWNKEHVKILYDLMNQNNIECDFICGSRKKYNDSNVLIGTIAKIGTGFDEATSCENFKGTKSNVLMLCTSTKNTGSLIQLMGRVARGDSFMVIDFVDKDRISKKHWYARRKVYMSYNAKII